MGDDEQLGESTATTYDESSDPRFAADEVAATVDLLAELGRGGRALEFGVGTGRIALPLAARGVMVHGIDLSQAAVDQLRAKPGSDSVEVTIGDFATTSVEGSFSLVYLVFNTIMNLPRQADQVTCFRNAAAHLNPGGCFVIEVGVPELRRLPPGQSTLMWAQDPRAGLMTSTTAQRNRSSGTTSTSWTVRGGITQVLTATCGRPSST